MITEEQIKNLKPGDPIFIQATFDHSDSFGDIWFAVPSAGIPGRTNFISPSRVHLTTSSQLPSTDRQSKYDPMRLFKKGDKVRVVERDGRHYDTMFDGKIWTVAKDEHSYSTLPRDVQVHDGYADNLHYTVPFYHLELVTPVEDTLPYYIVEKDIEFQVRMRIKNEDCLISTFRFKNSVEGYKRYYGMLPSMKQAREAAEAECDRLNSEYRKE